MKAEELRALIYHYGAALSPLSVAQTSIDKTLEGLLPGLANILAEPYKIGCLIQTGLNHTDVLENTEQPGGGKNVVMEKKTKC